MLKSSFTLLHNKNIHVSQYLGNTENADAQNIFEYSVNHFLNLFKCKPELLLTDKHPDYYSSRLSVRLSKEWNVPIIKVQHHEAHFAAVLAENNLCNEAEPVLGVIWDGTGFGSDHQIWGGEFFTWHHKEFCRVEHIEYYDWILGDKMAREPRIAALSLCKGIKDAEDLLYSKFSENEWNNYKKILSANQLKTSSVGRMFDAVASLLDVCDKNSFEGEAAMLLEELALKYFDQKPVTAENWVPSFDSRKISSQNFQVIIQNIINEINAGKDKAEIAARFHVSLILLIQKIAVSFNCHKICFSGGVFQNSLLSDLAIQILGKTNQLYFHQQLPPNDENISFGQLMHYLITKK
jgi:hydrogenase maturation protein HypF